MCKKPLYVSKIYHTSLPVLSLESKYLTGNLRTNTITSGLFKMKEFSFLFFFRIFKTKNHKGYGFINFIDAKTLKEFYEELNEVYWSEITNACENTSKVVKFDFF